MREFKRSKVKVMIRVSMVIYDEIIRIDGSPLTLASV